MQNLAKVIETYRRLFIQSNATARKSQVIYDLPYSPQYYNTEGVLCLFYKTLNRYFFTGNQVFLIQAYGYFKSLELDGWVIRYGYLKNKVFEQTVTRIESLIEVWFYKHAINLRYELLSEFTNKTITDDLSLFRHHRRLEGTQITTFENFKKQVDYFPENRLLYFTQLQKEEFTAFLKWNILLTDWTYRKEVGFNNTIFRSTESNVPVIEYDLQSLIYFKLKTLGIEWANKYLTEATARNAFIRQHGLIEGL